MALASESAAADLIYETFRAAWSPRAALYEDRPGDKPATAAYAHIFVKHATGSQRTLGPATTRRFEQIGVVIVQVFGAHLTEARTLATIVKDAFEGVTAESVDGRVRFFDVKMNEVGPDGSRYHVNVKSFFDYDLVK